MSTAGCTIVLVMNVDGEVDGANRIQNPRGQGPGPAQAYPRPLPVPLHGVATQAAVDDQGVCPARGQVPAGQKGGRGEGLQGAVQ